MRILLTSIFFLIFFSICEAKTITLDIPDNDIKIVENDVVNAEQWIKDAWAGKLASCKKRIVQTEVDRSIKSSESIPAGDDAIVTKVFSDPKYKSRKQIEDLKVR
jgi:hypothetical protein